MVDWCDWLGVELNKPYDDYIVNQPLYQLGFLYQFLYMFWYLFYGLSCPAACHPRRQLQSLFRYLLLYSPFPQQPAWQPPTQEELQPSC